MVPSGPPGGGQSIPPSLLRSNSALMGGQGGSVNSPQNGFNIQQRNQFNGMNMLANGANVSSLLHPSFGNGGPSTALSGPGSSQRGVIDNGADSDQLSSVNNGMGFNPQSSSFSVSNMGNPNEAQKFQQIQYQSGGGIGPFKLEQQMTNDQHGQSSLQLQAMRNLSQVQAMRGLAPVKFDGQHSDQSYMHPQQHQQMLQMSRQAPLLHQQRLMVQQQLQKLKSQQRSPVQSQFQPQNLPARSPSKPVYEPGMCARRLTQYIYQQQKRPEVRSSYLI